MDIAQSFGDDLVNGPAASIPRIAPSVAEWNQDAGLEANNALVRGRGERNESDNAAMIAMMAVLKLDRDRQDTLSSVITEAQNAIAAQCKFKL